MGIVSESPQHLLLQALNDQNQTAIDEHLAAEGVKDWINHRVQPEQLNNPIRQFKGISTITCLTFASLISDDAIVRQLVEAGADIDKRDSRGHSVLHYACASDVDSDAKVAYLMQLGASSQTATGGSEQAVLGSEVYSASLCLYQARQFRAILENHVVSVNATNSWGTPALHHAKSLRLAARFNQAGRVRALIDDHGASVNATDSCGSTPLSLAAVFGSAEAVDVLVSYPDCDFSITDRTCKTAADYARVGGHHDLAALIEAKYKGNFTEPF